MGRPEQGIGQGMDRGFGREGIEKGRMEGRGTEIRLAVIEDVDRLARLAQQVFSETYGMAIPAGLLNAYLTRVFAPEAFAAIVLEGTAALFVATVDGAIGGYGKLVATPVPDERMPSPAVELSTLYIDRRYQGLGLGTALMHHALAWAAHQLYGTMWLCVWQENQQALAFYQRFGFVIGGETEILVDGVVFHDWIMHRSTSETHTALPSPAAALARYSWSTTPPPPPPAQPGTVHSAS